MSDFDIIEIRAVGHTISKVLFDHYGERIEGAIERTLDINHGISASVELPLGTKLRVPLRSDEVLTVAADEPIRIFD